MSTRVCMLFFVFILSCSLSCFLASLSLPLISCSPAYFLLSLTRCCGFPYPFLLFMYLLSPSTSDSLYFISLLLLLLFFHPPHSFVVSHQSSLISDFLHVPVTHALLFSSVYLPPDFFSFLCFLFVKPFIT